jgi:hypothetical protein
MSTSGHHRSAGIPRRRSLWHRFIDAVAPPPNPNRMVAVAQVRREALTMAESSLTEAGILSAVRPVRNLKGVTSFEVLVPARAAKIAREALGSC